MLSWMLKKGPCRHCLLPMQSLIFLAPRAPFWLRHQVASVMRGAWSSRDPRRQIAVNLSHSNDSIPLAYDWLRMGMWHSHGQWDMKEVSTGGCLYKGFLCSLKDNVEGDFLFCLWIWLSACVSWNQAKRCSQQAEGGQLERQRNLGSWCSWC